MRLCEHLPSGKYYLVKNVVFNFYVKEEEYILHKDYGNHESNLYNWSVNSSIGGCYGGESMRYRPWYMIWKYVTTRLFDIYYIHNNFLAKNRRLRKVFYLLFPNVKRF